MYSRATINFHPTGPQVENVMMTPGGQVTSGLRPYINRQTRAKSIIEKEVERYTSHTHTHTIPFHPG